MRRLNNKVKVPEDEATNLLKTIEKLAQESAPRKQAWTAIRAFNLSTFQSLHKAGFQAFWAKQSSEKQASKGARLVAHDQYMRELFHQLPDEERARYEAEAEALNAKREETRLGLC